MSALANRTVDVPMAFANVSSVRFELPDDLGAWCYNVASDRTMHIWNQDSHDVLATCLRWIRKCISIWSCVTAVLGQWLRQWLSRHGAA